MFGFQSAKLPTADDPARAPGRRCLGRRLSTIASRRPNREAP